jgi:hypothetical protein
MSSKGKSENTAEVEEEVDDVEEGSENVSEEESDDSGSGRIAVDLTQNDFYKGMVSLLEDDEGNNILDYINLLHTELVGINKSLENLRLIRKDIARVADCAELFMKNGGGATGANSAPQTGDNIKKSDDVKKVKKST